MRHSQQAKDSLLIATTAITDGATVAETLDMDDADYAVIRVVISAEEGTDATAMSVSLLHSDDTVVTNFATITANESVDMASGGVLAYHVDMRGKKRYLRLSVTAGTGTGSNVTVAGVATKYAAKPGPSGTTNLADQAVIVN